MRKFGLALAVFALVFAAVPAFAQDAEPTIGEIAVAASTGEAPEFTVLVAALGAADPAFLEAVTNPDASLTVFAPTDAAFVALLEELGTTAEDLLANTDLLNTVLAYHVVPGVFTAENLVAAISSTAMDDMAGTLYVGTLLNETALAFSLGEAGVVINGGVNVVAVDIAGSNGVIHVIDTVLVPVVEENMMEMMEEPTLSIAETVVAAASAEAPEFTVLLAAVLAADPSILDTLTNGGPYTVFAPTDAAFVALLEALGTTAEDLLANTELLNTVLAYHVVPGELSSFTVAAALEANMGSFYVGTLYPGSLNISLDGESIKVNDATIVAVDVYATNGVVHVIDAVLVPPME
jgi:uncharacterized surface protein with fasciclin (FAS1) repeats